MMVVVMDLLVLGQPDCADLLGMLPYGRCGHIVATHAAENLASLGIGAVMLGYPGKMGMSGSRVWDEYLAGNIEGIRNYCETDVLNTYLVYLRWLLINGSLTQEQWLSELDLLKTELEASELSHIREFLAQWQAG